ncbi:hypothetical protein [Mycolicibacterium pulveris]|uniref:hypothetical protein n=1 Tax=Mycolicibacterium pulveris TaxID=36813 RepID=UPI003CEEF40F
MTVSTVALVDHREAKSLTVGMAVRMAMGMAVIVFPAMVMAVVVFATMVMAVIVFATMVMSVIVFATMVMIVIVFATMVMSVIIPATMVMIVIIPATMVMIVILVVLCDAIAAGAVRVIEGVVATGGVAAASAHREWTLHVHRVDRDARGGTCCVRAGYGGWAVDLCG